VTRPSPISDRPTVIAIDGPAGAGKSTIASLLAERLSLPYLDTGAMYRAVALLALRAGVSEPLDEADAARVMALLDDHAIEVDAGDDGLLVRIDGVDVSSELRSPECSMMASAVSAIPEVRKRLVALQREIGLRQGGVMEGRDITSVVFPDAVLRVFLTASPEERARRRFGDVRRLHPDATIDEVLRQQQQRDRQDTTRADSPLHVAPGVVVVDTTGSTPEEVVERLEDELDNARQKGA
jgi:cytidylate kinase